MDITPLISEEVYYINGYGTDGFRVSGEVYKHAICVAPNVVLDFSEKRLESLTVEDFLEIKASYPALELILLGCGEEIRPISSLLRNGLQAEGLKIDCLDTGSACRTYNVLLAEERRVATVIFPLSAKG